MIMRAPQPGLRMLGELGANSSARDNVKVDS